MRKYFLIVALLIMPLPAYGETPAAKEAGLAIAVEADRRDTGFGDSRAKLDMTLKDRKGNETVRHIRVRTLEVTGDGDKSMSIFDSPPDVKGTAFLTFTHKTGSDDQWLYMPALKRVKRISSANKSGSFMGSEFAYEDITSEEVEKYTYKFLYEEECDGKACFVIERYPTDPKSGYTRQILWMDKEEYRPLKIDFYDRKNSLLKTLTFRAYRKYLKQYWRASEMYMENHQTGKSTLLHWGDYEFRVGLKSRDFTKKRLERVR